MTYALIAWMVGKCRGKLGELCSDPDGTPDFDFTSPPTHGTVSSGSEGWTTYTPDAGYFGADAFSYSAEQDGETAFGTVSLEVAPGTKPVCVYRAETVSQATLTPLSLLCATGGDPIIAYGLSDSNGFAGDGNQTPHGSLTGLDNGLGKVRYQSDAGYAGPDSFAYSVQTGFGTSEPASFDLTVLDPQQGPQGSQGPQGPPGPAGSDGAVVTRDRLVIASFLDALTVRRGRAVVLRYVSTTSATVALDVFRGKRRVATVPGRARAGRNSTRWNGKIAKRVAPAGMYRLVLRAASADQRATDQATVRISKK